MCKTLDGCVLSPVEDVSQSDPADYSCKEMAIFPKRLSYAPPSKVSLVCSTASRSLPLVSIRLCSAVYMLLHMLHSMYQAEVASAALGTHSSEPCD